MSATEVILAELSEIERIIANEVRLASERLGYPVDSHSPKIQARVSEIILSGMGEHLRNPSSQRRSQVYETDTRNIAGRRSWVSNDALDSGFVRSTV